MRWVLGIDPGKKGGWCLLAEDKSEIHAGELPLAGQFYNMRNLIDTVDILTGPPSLVVVEGQKARGTDSIASINVLIPGFGQLVGWFQCLGWPMVTPMPKVWKEVILRHTTKDKNAAIARVQSRFPTVDLMPRPRMTTSHDGIADAVCIAEWGLTQL